MGLRIVVLLDFDFNILKGRSRQNLFLSGPNLDNLTIYIRELKQHRTLLTITSSSLHHHFTITSVVCLFIYVFVQACPTIH